MFRQCTIIMSEEKDTSHSEHGPEAPNMSALAGEVAGEMPQTEARRLGKQSLPHTCQSRIEVKQSTIDQTEFTRTHPLTSPNTAKSRTAETHSLGALGFKRRARVKERAQSGSGNDGAK